jgi:hypothetical protein
VLLHEEREEQLLGLWGGGKALCCLIEEDEGKTTGLRGYGNDRDGWRRDGGSVWPLVGQEIGVGVKMKMVVVG